MNTSLDVNISIDIYGGGTSLIGAGEYAILLEDGCNMLVEDGHAIILEG